MSLRKKKVKNLPPSLAVCMADDVQNAANGLLANIRFSSVDEPIKTLAMSSSVPNEGKTTVALALSLAIAKSGKTCLLVEGDMRRRSLRSALGAKTHLGVHAVLTRSCRFNEAISSTMQPGLSFLDAEPGIPNPESILSSKLYDDLLSILRNHYDYVVIDTPPISAFADSLLIAHRCDGTVLVTREGYTDRGELAFAVDQLRSADANLLGVAMNCQSADSSNSYYYYGYYYEEKRVPAHESAGIEGSRKEGDR